MTFGQKLKKLRVERGITQHELAKKLGYISNSYIADVEKGKFIPSKKKLKKIAKAMKLSYSQINNLLTESKIEEIGIHKPELKALVLDFLKMPDKEIKRIVKFYQKRA